MKYKNTDANLFRDIAVKIEKQDLLTANHLIDIALSIRPQGPILQKLSKSYKNSLGHQLKLVNDDYLVLAESARIIYYIDLTLFLQLITLLESIYKTQLINDKVMCSYLALANCERKYKKLEERLLLLSNKFSDLHSALNQVGIFDGYAISEAASEFSPVEIENKGSEKTLMVFGGMSTLPSLPKKEFFRSFKEKDINLIFVKDFAQCWYQKGLSGKSANLQDTTSYLLSCIPDKTKKLICLGTSSGGFAAIYFGHYLKADRIMAFSPQTIITEKVITRFASSGTSREDIDVGNKHLDLCNLTESKSLKVEVYVGRQNTMDFEAAQRIANFAQLKSFETDTHNIAAYLKSTGELSDILDTI